MLTENKKRLKVYEIIGGIKLNAYQYLKQKTVYTTYNLLLTFLKFIRRI